MAAVNESQASIKKLEVKVDKLIKDQDLWIKTCSAQGRVQEANKMEMKSLRKALEALDAKIDSQIVKQNAMCQKEDELFGDLFNNFKQLETKVGTPQDSFECEVKITELEATVNDLLDLKGKVDNLESKVAETGSVDEDKVRAAELILDVSLYCSVANNETSIHELY